PPPLSHTSPDPRLISPQLRQSASFSTVDRSNTDITPPRSDLGLTASKRYSDEGKTSGPWRKKSGFSSFVNSVLGSPRQVKISAPGNPVHVTHVGFDNETGKFTGLPKEWQRVLQENGIGENEQRQNPQAIYDIMTFYQGEGSNEEDAVWHKFDHARPQDPSQSGLSLLMPNNASAAGSHATLSTITSPPASSRFPSNHGANLENPRAPPPMPQTASIYNGVVSCIFIGETSYAHDRHEEDHHSYSLDSRLHLVEYAHLESSYIAWQQPFAADKIWGSYFDSDEFIYERPDPDSISGIRMPSNHDLYPSRLTVGDHPKGFTEW
ncbi:MAG: hypothetical protein Q9226_006056, partial [Calogaya cf. arnoldii]